MLAMKHVMIKIKVATFNDLPVVMRIFDQAKRFLKENKIPQWQDGTPNEETFSEDIKSQELFLLVNDSDILGIAALKLGPDPFYDEIREGEWLSDAPYYVIHRFAMAQEARGKQLSETFIQKMLEIVKHQSIAHVRIDTHPRNMAMQRVIEKVGFQYCGIVDVTLEQSDPTRKAYELKLT